MGIFAVLDPRFEACIDGDAGLEKLWAGGKWIEGPAWLARSGQLIWSDIPHNRMLRWDYASGAVDEFRRPSHGSNGNTVDREGRLVTCEHNTRRITRTEIDGSVTVMADRFDGKRFNSPNDVVVKSDGSIWFTDPDYGRSPDYEGELELAGCHVYRLDPATGALRQMTSDFVMPNGLAFSLDEAQLYIIDTGSTYKADGPNHIRRFRVGPDHNLSGGEVFATDPKKFLDGFRLDVVGRLWCGAGDGVDCYHPDGTLIGKIAVPERVANLTFGGPGNDELLMCATTSVYRVRLKTRGAARPSPLR
jgi:gluconolactonase